MKFDDYQKKAAETAVYPSHIGLAYTTLGLAGESGEVANKVKKIYRDNEGEVAAETREELKKELSDVLWYLAATATELGLDLGAIAAYNLQKLAGRAERGTIQGSGDDR